MVDGKKIQEVTFGDVGEKLTSGKGCLCGCCSLTGFILLMMFVPASISQLGQRKLGLIKNGVTGVVDLDTTYTPGRYWVGFWSSFIELPSTLNTIEFSDERPEEGVAELGVLRSRDMDGKRIFLDLSLQYKLYPEKIGQLYREFQEGYEDVYISALRDSLSKVGNLFAIGKVWEDYDEINDMMRAACVETLASRHAECWDLQVWRVRLEDRYEDALVRTQVRKQAQHTENARKSHSTVRAETQVVLAEYRKNVTVIESRGIAEKYQLERAALAQAEENLVSVQAEILELIRDTVSLSDANGTQVVKMTDSQLVTYQKLMMLQSQKEAHFVYSGGPVETVNVRSAQQLLDGDRRLFEL